MDENEERSLTGTYHSHASCIRGREAVPRHHPRWEPGALAAPAGICAGGGEQSPSLPRRGWVRALADDPQHAFPGQGQMKPEQLEIAQLKREVIKLKAERDILKKAAAYFAKEST